MGTNKTLAGPAYLAASVADVFTPPASTMTSTIRLIHIANVSSSAVNATLYRGASGGSTGGTEICKGLVIPANDVRLLPLALEMSSTHYLTGLASVVSSLVITVMGEQRVV